MPGPARLALAMSLLLWPLLAPARAEAPQTPVTWPGPAPQQRRVRDVAAAEEECQGCHARIAAEWRASYHHRAATDPAVARALRAERLPFCRGCHAPEADPQQDAPAWARQLGVGCLTCHVPVDERSSAALDATDAVVSGPADRPARDAPHPVLRDPSWRPVGACARCHQFAFPDPGRRAGLMQLTVREHEAGPYKDRACVDCHMPRAPDGHRSHRFPGGHDAGFLRAALAVQAERPAADRVRLHLQPREVGHALPTGDLFRRVTVRARATTASAGPVEAVRWLTRHPHGRAPGPLAPGPPPVRPDDRLRGPTVVELALPGAVGPVRWSVTYERVLMPGRDGHGDRIDGTIELARGEL